MRKSLPSRAWGFALAPLPLLAGALCTLALNVAPARAAAACPNEAVRMESNLNPETHLPLSLQLPDCRAYELVSPPYKEGEIVIPQYISQDGSHMVGPSFGVFNGAGQDESLAGTEYMFTRTSTGWVTSPLDPPASEGYARRSAVENLGSEGGDVSADFSKELYAGVSRTSEPPATSDFYLKEPSGFEEVGPGLSTGAIQASEVYEAERPSQESGILAAVGYRGGSSNLSHVLFSVLGPTNNPAEGASVNFLWPGDTTAASTVLGQRGFESLYQYVGIGDSEPALVGVRNPGPLAGHPNVNDGAELISQCGTYLGGPESYDTYNAVSRSGATVFFTAMNNERCPGAQPSVSELYARINGSATVKISEPSVADCSECHTSTGIAEGVFQGASEDGSKVFFLTEQELLPSQKGMNLYEYDFDNEAGHKIVLVSGGSVKPEVQGVARVSMDGSRVYFVAQAVLTGPNGEREAPMAGEDNLYVFERDQRFPAGHTTFVATLLTKEEERESEEACEKIEIEEAVGWQAEVRACRRDRRTVKEVWGREDRGRSAEAQPANGRFLVFSSARDLLAEGYTSHVPQLFRYDAQEERLVRISIGQGGFNSNGVSGVYRDSPALHGSSSAANFIGFAKAAPTFRSMSDDGSFVFFQSSDGLTSQAINDPNGEYNNIYEYHDGNVYLVSDGRDRSRFGKAESGVQLFGTTASGNGVFFTTADELVRQDTDTGLDVYDAQIEGGFPAPVLPGGCEGEACQGGLSPSPSPPSVGSVTQRGAGNLAPPGVSTMPTLVAKPKGKALTRAQKLANALKACRRKPKRRRAACERQARKNYGGKSKAANSDVGRGK